MEILSTPLADLYVVNTAYHNDSRGGFARLFCDHELSDLLGHRKIVQINHSVTTSKGAIRGFHFQHPPSEEMKIVRCLKGRVFDVAVDLRSGSKTFLKWHAEILSDENSKAFVIPEGFAHGFQSLDEETELLYLHTAHYQPQYEDGLRFDDPLISVKWPLNPTEISDRDLSHKLLDSSFLGVSQ